MTGWKGRLLAWLHKRWASALLAVWASGAGGTAASKPGWREGCLAGSLPVAAQLSLCSLGSVSTRPLGALPPCELRRPSRKPQRRGLTWLLPPRQETKTTEREQWSPDSKPKQLPGSLGRRGPRRGKKLTSSRACGFCRACRAASAESFLLAGAVGPDALKAKPLQPHRKALPLGPSHTSFSPSRLPGRQTKPVPEARGWESASPRPTISRLSAPAPRPQPLSWTTREPLLAGLALPAPLAPHLPPRRCSLQATRGPTSQPNSLKSRQWCPIALKMKSI